MTEKTNQVGNSEAPDKEVFDSDDFFEALDHDVNGAVFNDAEGIDKATPAEQDSTNQNQQAQPDEANELDSLKKRYSDSSREAQKMKAQLDELKPFVPVLDAMKSDSNLVEHVRDYFTSGGQPSKTVTEKLNLPEDFIFDGHEAVTDPDSDSAKVMGAHVDGLVNAKVGNILEREKASASVLQQKVMQQRAEEDFRKKHNINDDQFKDMVSWAKERPLELEDIYFLQNREKTQANIAKSTKEDMLSQMHNVRNQPTSQSNANSSAGDSNLSQDDQMFKQLFGDMIENDNLFG